MADSDGEANSLCAVYAELAENQLRSDDPDMSVVFDQLENIKQHCGVIPYAPGETPDHLEAHQFEDGEGGGAEGVVVVDGKPMPASAAEKRDESG